MYTTPLDLLHAMRIPELSRLLTALLAIDASLVSAFSLTPRDEPARNSTGLTDVVSWDNYTLWLQDQRIFLQ